MLSIESIRTVVNGAIGPLAPLYDNKYQSTTLRYPRDLGSNPSRKHSIVFTVREANPEALGEVFTSGVENLRGALTNLGPAASSALETALGQVRSGNFSGVIGTLNEVALKEGLEAGNKIQETVNNLTKSLSSLKRKNGATIGLYIPDTVNVAYDVSYDSDFSLSNALGKPYFLAQGAASLYNTFKDQGDLKMSNLVNAAGSDPFVRDFVASQVGRLTGTDLSRLGLAAGGFATNPQLQVLFSGVGFRQFQFDFLFSPYSQEESLVVEQIIKTFKYAAAPEIVPNGIFTQSLYMKIPDTFNINFFYGNQENKKVHKIGESVLTNVNVDYSGTGQWATFDDGAPLQIRMTLQFLETVIIDKRRINEGY